jgi:hypothetical protein
MGASGWAWAIPSPRPHPASPKPPDSRTVVAILIASFTVWVSRKVLPTLPSGLLPSICRSAVNDDQAKSCHGPPHLSGRRAGRRPGLGRAVHEGDARRWRTPTTRPVVTPIVAVVVVVVDVAVVVVVTVPAVPVVAPPWIPVVTGAPVIRRDGRHRLALGDTAGQPQCGQAQAA